VEQQQELQKRNYLYQPRDPVVRQHYQEQTEQKSQGREERQQGKDSARETKRGQGQERGRDRKE
jgi:hypothetical protein